MGANRSDIRRPMRNCFVANESEALHREKLLQGVTSPLTAGLIPQALRPHGEWVATRLNIFSAAYNTTLAKKAAKCAKLAGRRKG